VPDHDHRARDQTVADGLLGGRIQRREAGKGLR
jgi:hypothetical protein